jgi:lipopolysaccharide export system permease protein
MMPRLIKKLDIFIIKQFGLLFVGTFLICQFVLMMQFLWKYVDELIGKGLSLEVLAQFFWYMGLMLMPQAFPLAILLSSLIAFGNLGESSELTAIKAAGISLMQAFRPLIVVAILIASCSFYFQNVVGPHANQSFRQLLLAMRQKSPELEIPEGIFYDGIPGTNLYVQKKDLETGMLYGIMIYRMSNSYEDAAIILADSGKLQSTAEKKHLLLSLYNGEWFENMRSQDMGNSASIPYRRETFWYKTILLDFDGGFTVSDIAAVRNDATSKSLQQIMSDLDSIKVFNDSVGLAFYQQAQMGIMRQPVLSKADSLKVVKEMEKSTVDFDSVFARLSNDQKQNAIKSAFNNAQSAAFDLDMKGEYIFGLKRNERWHQIEGINKITLSLLCIIFFFIGAPLGAIIRKGGLGVPVIIAVLVFIIYYIFENTGMRMAREDEWTVWYGKLISTVALAPVAAFFTYKATNDSVVFHIDLYKEIAMRMLGLRMKRHIYRKEVIISPPDYELDMDMLNEITTNIRRYNEQHKLLYWPNPIRVFFHAGDDQEIEEINNVLETVVEDLGFTTDKYILSKLNDYPIIATHAHTRPFQKKWLNIATGLIIPVGVFFYFRMVRFRLRLYRDLHAILKTNDDIYNRIVKMEGAKLIDEE